MIAAAAPQVGGHAISRVITPGQSIGDSMTSSMLSSVRKRSEERRVGKECSVRVDLGGRRIIKKKKQLIKQYQAHTNSHRTRKSKTQQYRRRSTNTVHMHVIT